MSKWAECRAEAEGRMKQGEVLLQNGEGDDLTGAVLILAGSMFEIASALHSIAGSFDYGLTITTVKE